MKILLAQNSTYVPAHGGANKANRLLMTGLAARGHTCRVVAPAGDAQGTAVHTQLADRLIRQGIHVSRSSDDIVAFEHHRVQVMAVARAAQLRTCVAAQIRTFEPTWTLVSSEDPGQVLLAAALKASPGRIVYLAHTMLQFPFGPHSFLPGPARTELLRQTAGIITVSRYLQGYFRHWAGLESAAIPFPVYGDGPFPYYARFDSGAVTLINPCAYKGLATFGALARALPDVPFAAVPTWGTTNADRATLETLPNVQTLPPSDDVNDILAQTRVLLVPSLWGEAFGQIVVEAMLRGIPVLASDVGGLPEAKLSVDYVLPVQPITRYEERFDDRGLPVPVVPQQDVTPWLAALRELLSDRARYEQLAAASRRAALAFVAQTGIEPFETYLQNLAPAGQYRAVTPPGQRMDFSTEDQHHRLDHLSAKKRALLALRLRQKSDEQSTP